MKLFLSASSVGIIGGADGPTSIFITGDFSALLLAAAVLAGLIFILAKKKK